MLLNKLKTLITTSLILASYFSFSAAVETVTNLNATGTGSFASALANVNIGGTINFNSGLSGTISVAGLQTTKSVTINGNPNVILDGGGTYRVQPWVTNLFQVLASNVTIKDMTFQNSQGPNTWDGYGVLLTDGLENITFENCNFLNNKQSGVANSNFSPTGKPTGIKNLSFINCMASGNKFAGLSIILTDGITISGGEYYANTTMGIQFERSVVNGTIDNVKVYENGLPSTGNTNANVGAGIRVYDGGTAQKSSKITISNCKIYKNNIHGIELPLDADNVNIFKNEIYENGTGTANGNQACGIAFQFGANDNCTVAENNIYDNKDPGIYMYHLSQFKEHTGNVFYKNIVTNNGGGIIIWGTVNSFISENIITKTTTENAVIGGLNGIYVSDSSNNSVIYKNSIIGTVNGSGILISDANGRLKKNDNVYILANTIDDNQGEGIKIENSNNTFIGTTANAPTISRTITGYGTIEIGVGNKAYKTVEPNTITKNKAGGIIIENSTKTLISQDAIYCNGGFGDQKIVYNNVQHTTITSDEITIDKNTVDNIATLKNLETVTNSPVEAYLFDADSKGCTDAPYTHLQTKALENDNSLKLDIPNLATVDSVLLFVTNVEGNTFPVIVQLNRLITENNAVSNNSIATYVQNGLFVIKNADNASVIVSNTQGQVVQQLENINSTEIGNSLSNGLYFIYIESSNGDISTQKYLK